MSPMEISVFLLVLLLLQTPLSSSTNVLEGGSSLSVESYLISDNGVYSAGFFSVGNNTFCFAIWFTKSSPLTAAWMANRDKPVNGKGSKILLMKNGDLSLTDAGGIPIWNSKSFSPSPVRLFLLDTGNLVLKNSSTTLWESFNSPTDTLLPGQPLTRDTQLVSSRSGDNYSSGPYTFYFDNDNVLRLLYYGTEVSSVYWPDPAFMIWNTGRTTYNNSQIAVFNNLGYFRSSDKLSFTPIDFGIGPKRRLTLDFDGNVRMYSLEEAHGTWTVSWQALSRPCMIHGSCGPNSLCSYVPNSGRTCSCLPGFKFKNRLDWSHGCEPALESKIYCNHTESCDCKSFMLLFRDNVYKCYTKSLLVNGYRSAHFDGITFLKLPKTSSLFMSDDKSQSMPTLRCPQTTNKEPDEITEGYILAATGFKKFSYAELRKATQNFTEEIGRGAGGIVYKGLLSDGRVAAIKRLNEASQGEAEFLAEVSIIGKLNHMNLIEMWGYCVERKHRLLIYEYMEHGSLAENLSSNALKCKKLFEIAVGTAKGLAYLHEECLEWILHCDIKPQNILLDSNYQPKVADFGLSKLLNRGGLNDSNFSRIRGTRGYMAPEWVSNLPITSKVDVYSYGIVLLEMVTGKSPAAPFHTFEIEGMKERGTLVPWVREKKNGAASREAWIEEIVDPMISCNYDVNKMEIMVKVALQCVEEDRDARPSMSQVVEMLLTSEDESSHASKFIF